MKRKFLALVLFAAVFAAIGAIYFFGGHHNHVGSRSYFLEKDIRDLLFRETHGPIDYKYAAAKYQAILSKIRFDDSREDLTRRYSKGLKRAQLKALVQEHLELYRKTSDLVHVQKSWDILRGANYLSTEEYGYTSFYWNGVLIDGEWIKNELKH